VKELVQCRKEAMIAGIFRVFPDLTDEDLLAMDYFIEGVEGALP